MLGNEPPGFSVRRVRRMKSKDRPHLWTTNQGGMELFQMNDPGPVRVDGVEVSVVWFPPGNYYVED
jgi:hypothetical protein